MNVNKVVTPKSNDKGAVVKQLLFYNITVISMLLSLKNVYIPVIGYLICRMTA